MNNQIQLVLKSSTTELPLNDREYGIYLVPELDGLTGLPAIRTTSGVNSGYDGGWTSAQNYDARSITIRGVIANEDIATVERLRKQLTSLVGQGKSEELTLDLVTEAGNAYTLQVRTIALEMAMQRVLKQQEFMLQLRADDPLIYDSSETAHEALIQVSKATGGFLINFELPLAITGGSEEAVVTNDGLEQVPTITRMYGALHNPKIINHTTNQSMQIMADLGYSEGDWHTPSNPVEGKVVELHNTPDNAPFADINLKGNTEQQTYTGKNLLKLSTADGTSIEKNGITATYNFDEQTITFDGTCSTNNTSFKISNNDIDFISGTTKSTTYYVSGSISGYCQMRHYDASWGQNVSYNINTLSSSTPILSATASSTFTATNGTQQSIRFNSGSVASNFKIKIMVADSSDTSYEPYVGGTASPNPSYPQDVRVVTGSNTIKICGKNLLNYTEVETGTENDVTCSFDATSGIITLNGTCSANNTVFTFANSDMALSGRYVYSYTVIGGSISGTARLRSMDASWGNALNVNLTDDSSANSGSIYSTHTHNDILVQNGTIFNNYRIQVQFEKKDEGGATEFEPYQGQSYTLSLGSLELYKIGTYQDYIYKSGDKWYKHNAIGKYVYNNDLAENGIGSTHVAMLTPTLPVIPNLEYASGLFFSNSYTPIVHNNTGLQGSTSGSKIRINTALNIASDYATVRSLAAANNLTIYYPLATTSDTEITDTTLIEQLNNMTNLARTYGGLTYIQAVQSGLNAQAVTEVSYMTEKNPDNRDLIVIDSRLRTITLNGLDVYHLQADGSEFIMLAPGENRISLQSDITGDNGYAEVSYKQGYLSI